MTEQSTILSKGYVGKALAQFARPSTPMGLGLFLVEFALYWGALAAVLFLPALWQKVAASIFAGLKLSALLTLGHDAMHNSLTPNKRLNALLGVLCFVPCLHNYRLWVRDHHRFHHLDTNGEHFDSYTPLTKPEYDALPVYRRVFERVIRSPYLFGIGFSIHYLFQRMLLVRIFPTAEVPAQYRKAAWEHFAVIAVYAAGLLTLLAAAPTFAPVSQGGALLLGFAVPLVVFAALTGGSLYLMHTHPDIPWFREAATQPEGMHPALYSTHLTLPRPLSRLVHNVFAHSAHHAHAGIPCYRLLEAQACLDQMLGASAVVEPLTVKGMLRTMHTCKLYDFEHHQWLDFAGNATSNPGAKRARR